MGFKELSSAWERISHVVESFLSDHAARHQSPPPEPLGAFDAIIKRSATQLLPIARAHAAKMQQLQQQTQSMLLEAIFSSHVAEEEAEAKRAEWLKKTKELQAETQGAIDRHEAASQEIYGKYFQKVEKLNGEWMDHLTAREPGSRVLGVLHSLREIFAQFLVEELQAKRVAETLTLSVSDLALLKATHGTPLVVEAVMKMIGSGAISFPFKRYSLGNPAELFQNLIAYQPIRSDEPYQPQNIRFQTQLFPFLFEGRPLLVVSQGNDYETMDVISDFFQEEQRMKAIRADQQKSPWESWHDKNFTFRIIQKVLNGPGPLTPHVLREELYQGVKECTQFKPSLVVSMIRILNGTRMLDFSAGWGDRLIGAMAAGVERYVGVDPNLDLKPGHDAMRRSFGTSPHLQNASTSYLSPEERFKIIYSPFQTAELPADQTFDLVFTSPPFFDFEIYTQREGQSAKDFREFDAWVVGFLYVSLEKAWSVLDVGGHMAIHITDIMKTRVCEPMNLYAQMRLPGSRFAGLISSSGKAERPRPIWVWQKMGTTDGKRAADAERDLGKFFPSIYARVVNANNNKKRKHEE